VWGQEGEMTQALYAHMNNKTIKKPQRHSVDIGYTIHWMEKRIHE
jgi:hypothetical protein